MCLFTADGFEGELIDCNEGCLEWVLKSDIPGLNLWTGDLLFFRLLDEKVPFFSLKLRYEGDFLAEWQLNGRDMTGTVLSDEKWAEILDSLRQV